MTFNLWLCICSHILVCLTHFVRGNVYSDDGRRFKCPLDPLTDRYPDPTDPTCVNYFLCHLGHAFARKCDVRTAFHPELKECFPRYQVPETLCALPVDCDYNGYMSDPEDCTKYYICFFRQAIHYSCLTNFYFDPKKNLCIKDKKKANTCSKPMPAPGPSPKKKIFHRTRYVRPAPSPESPSKLENSEFGSNNNNANTKTVPQFEDGDLVGSDSTIPEADLTQQSDIIDVEDERAEQFPKAKRNVETADFELAQNTTINGT